MPISVTACFTNVSSDVAVSSFELGRSYKAVILEIHYPLSIIHQPRVAGNTLPSCCKILIGFPSTHKDDDG